MKKKIYQLIIFFLIAVIAPLYALQARDLRVHNATALPMNITVQFVVQIKFGVQELVNKIISLSPKQQQLIEIPMKASELTVYHKFRLGIVDIKGRECRTIILPKKGGSVTITKKGNLFVCKASYDK